jgi:hypothetical protein
MAKLAVVAVALAAIVGLGACSSARRADDSPSASIGPGVERLAGHWQGSLWEVAGHLYQGSSTLDIQLAENGTWRGRIGKDPASGTARLSGQRLVIEGTVGPADGPQRAVYVTLTGDDTRRWGEVEAVFGGREARAMLDMRRQSP